MLSYKIHEFYSVVFGIYHYGATNLLIKVEAKVQFLIEIA